MAIDVVLRSARDDEAGLLTELALRSKAYWGYSEEFLAACRAELMVTPRKLRSGRMVVAEVSGQVRGFYSLDGQPPEGELGNLWVEPSAIGTGLGRRLWQDAIQAAEAAGFTSLRVEAEPSAEGFYLAMGAQRVGGVPSGLIPGRTLPLLVVAVAGN
jgi:ribosomal protein S18 acetylase RimI-like enzyme